MAIGFFDSGIGGISVLEKAMDTLNGADFLFYADLKHVPYGKKSPEEIIRYVDDAVQFLRNEGADIVVLACNTATSAAANYLRGKYDFPILGMEPAVKVAYSTTMSSALDKIIVTATDLTLKLEKLDTLIQHLGVNDNVEELSLQRLVDYAENDQFDNENVESYLYGQFSSIDLSKACAVVLGCTHFTFYKTLICNVMLQLTGRHVPIIDGNTGTVNHLATLITNGSHEKQKQRHSIRIFESGVEVPLNKYRALFTRAHQENARRC